MSDDTTSPVTLEHLKGFGAIVHFFAEAEHLMHIAAAGILDTDMGTAVILLGDMAYGKKRQTLRHLNTTIGVDGKISPEVSSFLDAIHKEQNIRNWAAHATWKAGKREGSIKPLQLFLRSDEPKPLGHWHNEKDWTAEDLWDAATRIYHLTRSFRAYLEASGLVSRVEARIDAIKESTASSPG